MIKTFLMTFLLWHLNMLKYIVEVSQWSHYICFSRTQRCMKRIIVKMCVKWLPPPIIMTTINSYKFSWMSAVTDSSKYCNECQVVSLIKHFYTSHPKPSQCRKSNAIIDWFMPFPLWCVKLQNLEGKGCYLLVLTVFVELYFYDYVSSSHRHSTTTSAFYNSNPGMNNWSTISNQIQRRLDQDSLAWIQVKIEIEICEGNMPPADCWELKCWLLIITLLKTLEIE